MDARQGTNGGATALPSMKSLSGLRPGQLGASAHRAYAGGLIALDSRWRACLSSSRNRSSVAVRQSGQTISANSPSFINTSHASDSGASSFGARRRQRAHTGRSRNKPSLRQMAARGRRAWRGEASHNGRSIQPDIQCGRRGVTLSPAGGSVQQPPWRDTPCDYDTRSGPRATTGRIRSPVGGSRPRPSSVSQRRRPPRG